MYCLVGCLSMIVWTHAVLGVFYACLFYFCICTCSAQFHMFHIEICSLLLLLSLSKQLKQFLQKEGGQPQTRHLGYHWFLPDHRPSDPDGLQTIPDHTQFSTTGKGAYFMHIFPCIYTKSVQTYTFAQTCKYG